MDWDHLTNTTTDSDNQTPAWEKPPKFEIADNNPLCQLDHFNIFTDPELTKPHDNKLN